MDKSPAIAIDLGTTDTCVAVFQNGTVEVISNENGNRTTPSYVAFTNNERLIGEAAKNQLATNPDNTVFAFKRLIGRRYDNLELITHPKYWPFETVYQEGKPKIIISYKGQPKVLSIEEISAMVLSKMKETAENYLGREVQNAVITVPSSFNDAQRQATKDAAIIAGLNPIRIINEPTAAAIAYGFYRREKRERKVLIFDLGGGTCNVSILSIEDYIFEVKATAGDNSLGGEDFDERLMEHFIKQFRDKHKKDLSSSKRALNRLRIHCEKIKRVLSSIKQTVVEIDSLMDGIDFYTTITRKEFEEINAELFMNTMKPVETALQDAKLLVHDIDDVILVGGSTRIPKIQELLQDFFKGKTLNKSMNMVEAVAHGAAMQAAILSGDRSTGLEDMLLLDVIPLSLGIASGSGGMITVIKRNTNIPIVGTHHHKFTCKGRFVEIDVYEGERALVKDNHLLGKFELDIPVRGLSTVNLEITFDVDANSILKITAIETSSKRECRVTARDCKRLKKEEIHKMIEFEKQYRQDDEQQRDVITARNNLEAHCYTLKDNSSTDVGQKCYEVLAWLETTGLHASKTEVERKRKELDGYVQNPNESMQVTEACFNVLSSAEDAINKLKCGVCNKYLSYFPITINSDKVSVCGRCVHLIGGDPIPNTAYESLAEFLKFPCIYQPDGCLQNLYPSEVPHHEVNCPFRRISCTLCKWEGTISDLLKHFEEEHPTAVRRNPEFEVDFTHSYEIFELLVHKDEIFSFKRKYSQSTQVLECSVFCYKVKDSNITYNYQITFLNVCDENKCMYCPPALTDSFHEENVTAISKDQMKQDLHNPPVVLGTVKVLQLDSAQPSEEPKQKRINPEVNYDLLSELECPVCFNYIIPPIFQCTTGHSICEECKGHIHECPICKKEIQNSHNITLEKVAQLLTYPCKFIEYGCDYASKSSNIKEHQKYCIHGPYLCPLNDYERCEYKVPLKNLFAHILSSHRAHFLESNTINVPIDGRYYNREDSACYVIKFGKLLFKLQYLYKMSVFYWSMQLIGLPEDAKKYQFEIDICDNSNSNQRLFLRSSCAPLAKRDSSFEMIDKYVFVKLDQISSFISDAFTYKIRVIV